MPSRVAVPRPGGREEAPPGPESLSLEQQQQQQQQQQTRRRKGSLRKAAMFGRGAAQRDQQPQSPLQHSHVASKTVPSSAVSAATAAASSSSHTLHTSHTSPPAASATASTTNSIPPPGQVPDDHASSSGASGLGISVLDTATPRASIDDYASRAASAAATAALHSPIPKSAKTAAAAKFFTSPRSSTDSIEDAPVASSASTGASATAALTAATTSGASVSTRRHDRKRSNSGSIATSPVLSRATASLAITEEETTHPSKLGRSPTSPTSPGLNNSSSSTGAGIKSAATAAAVAATTSLRASIGSESHDAGISTSPGATASSPGRLLFSGALASSGAVSVSHQRRRGNSNSGAGQQAVPSSATSAATTTTTTTGAAQTVQKPTPRRLSQSAQQPPLPTPALSQSKVTTTRIPERVAEQPVRTVPRQHQQQQPALRPISQASQTSQTSQTSQASQIQARQQIHSLLQDQHRHRHHMQPPLPPKQRAKSPLALSDLVTPLASSSSAAVGVSVGVGVGGVNVVAVGDPDWDYAETAWWGWVMLIVTWVVFVTGMGSCLGVWSWAWDVGKTPYAPPELEDDPTLPIVGYYPALLILTCVMAWVWVVVAWIGMKYFKHAKISGD